MKRKKLQIELLESRHLLAGDVLSEPPTPIESSTPPAPITWFEQFDHVDRIALDRLANVDQLLPEGVAGPSASAVGEWIVQLDADATGELRYLSDADSLLNENTTASFTLISGLGSEGLLLVRGQGLSRAEIEASLTTNESVESFSLNQLISGQATAPNDPEFVAGLLPGLDLIDAENAWDVSIGSLSTVVGVVDTGIDPTHPDLYLNIWLNQGEIPSEYLDDDGNQLIDIDGDGLITFYDLNNATRSATAPYTLTVGGFESGPNAEFVNDLNNNGRIDAADLLADANWADGRDTDGNGFFDDFFGANFRAGVDDPLPSNDPSDQLGHGTHVAGTIGAIGGNGTGVVGVNWQTSLMSLRILDNNNQGDSGAAITAINYARQMGERLTTDSDNRVTEGANVRVLNNSWGQPGGFEQSLEAAIADTNDAGILFVAAAGNGNIIGNGVDNDRTPFYPASYDSPNVIAVAASDASDNLATFSNFGQTSVDLFAPGVGIRSTLPGGGYGSANGTSMASPHVAGTAALIWAALPGATVDEVKQAILSTTEPIEQATKVSTGGRLNADAAINATLFAPVAEFVSVDEILENAASTEFQVRYQSRSGIEISTIDTTDLSIFRLWGPKDEVAVEFISHTVEQQNASSQPSIVLATYRVLAPDGSWDPLDFGGYDISVRPDSVTSVEGTPVRAERIGEFGVRIESPSVFYVNSFSDETDAGVGDGICSTELGTCTLRAAVQEANAAAPAQRTIILQAGTYERFDPSTVSSNPLLEAHDDTFIVDGIFSMIDFSPDLLIANDFIGGSDRGAVSLISVEAIEGETEGMVSLVSGQISYSNFNPETVVDRFQYTISDGVNTSSAFVTLDTGFTTYTEGLLFTTEESGDLAIFGNVTIAADDPDTSTISANSFDRVFTVHQGGSLALRHVSVSDGRALGVFSGGGIAAFDDLTLDNVKVDNNEAGNASVSLGNFLSTFGLTHTGGGIAVVSGDTTIVESTLSNNRASYGGGAHLSGFGGSLTIDASLIFNNESLLSAGVSGFAEITNSTFSANGINSSSGFEDPGPVGAELGIVVGGATLTHVTVIDSRSDEEFPFYPTVAGTVKNTIFAGNPGDEIFAMDFMGISLGGNVFKGIGGMSLELSDTIAETRHLIGPLADNGGPTQTHALLLSNPARGAAVADAVTLDQRGRLRTGSFDSGAFEASSNIVQGKLFEDTFRDGELNVSESGLSDIVVYLDSNGDGVLNPGEASAVTSGDDPNTPNVIESGNFTLETTVDGNYELAIDLGGFSLSDPSVSRLSGITPSIVGTADSLFENALERYSVSGDGRYIAFATTVDISEPDADAGCFHEQTYNDVYVYDTVFQTYELISQSRFEHTPGVRCAANGDSFDPVISDDGRYVAFVSDATDIISSGPDQVDNALDIFLYDRQEETFIHVSRPVASESSSSRDASNPSMSSDGRFITYESSSRELVDSTLAFNSQRTRIYLFDRDAPDSTLLVSQATDPATDVNGSSFNAVISSNGVFVAFESFASNLTSDATNGVAQIYLYDRTGVEPLKLISKNSDGTVFDNRAFQPSISENGNTVAFGTTSEVAVYDSLANAVTTVLPASASGIRYSPAISRDGQYLAYPSTTASDGIAIYVSDLLSGSSDDRLLSVRSGASAIPEPANGNSYQPLFLEDSDRLLFRSVSDELVADGFNPLSDSSLYSARNPFFSKNERIPLELSDAAYLVDVDFGVFPNPGRIGGIVFDDIVGNGVFDEGEPLLSEDWVLYLDDNGNRELDPNELSVVPTDGVFAFENIESNRSYSLRANPPSGREIVSPESDDNFQWTLFLPPDGNLDGFDFGSRFIDSTGQSSASELSGRLYEDRDGSGDFNAGDIPLAGREVFLDASNFGVRDANEPRELTDANGEYSFAGLSSRNVAVSTTLDSTLVHVNPLGSDFELAQYPLFPTVQPFGNPQSIGTGDFNGDGFLDVAVALGEGNQLSIRLNDGSGGFLPDQINVDLGQDGSGPTSLVVGQFDGDSRLDVALTANFAGNVTVLSNFDPVTMTFSSTSYVGVGDEPLDIAVGQFGGDAGADLVVVNEGGDTIQLLINNGSGVFTAQTAVPSGGNGSVSIVVGRFSGDVFDDVAVVHSSPIDSTSPLGGVTVLAGNGAGGLALQADYYEVGAFPIDSVAADLNQDGLTDLAVANFLSNSISVLLGQADGTFRVQNAILGTASGAFDIALGDVDNDGDVDLFASNLLDRNVSIFRNNGPDPVSGDVRFQPLENIGLGQFSLAQRMPLVVANFDNDTSGPGGTGTLDIITIPRLTDTLHVLKNTLVDGAHRVALTGLNVIEGVDFIIQPSTLPPSFDSITDPLAIFEDADQQSLTINGITKGRTSGPDLQFTVTSDNPSLVPSPGLLTFAGGSSTSLTYTPVANESGTAVLTVRVVDAGADELFGGADDGIFEQSFTVTVLPVNDAPVFNMPFAASAKQTDGLTTVTNFVTGIGNGGGDDENSQSRDPMDVIVTDTSFFTTQPAIDSSGTLTFTPNSDKSGSVPVVVTLKDSGGRANGGVDTTTKVFLINVGPVNDPPTFTLMANPNRNVLQTAGPQLVNDFVASFSPGGGPDEATQMVSNYIVTVDTLGIFSVLPSISNDGTLTFTPANDRVGLANVNVQVRDDGGRANGGNDLSAVTTFTIAVTDVDFEPNQFIVNTTADTPDANPGDGMALDMGGNTSLRAAIEEANATANLPSGPDMITFNIPGSGPHASTLLTPLPAIMEPLLIDGTSEPDYSGSPMVILDGASLSNPSDHGLSISADGVIVDGLLIEQFPGDGIEFVSVTGGEVRNTIVRSNDRNGIYLENSADVVISQSRIVTNGLAGVQTIGALATGNQIVANSIGVDDSNPAAPVAAGNLAYGVLLSSPDNVVQDNTISGNAVAGVLVTSHDNMLLGNRIGTNALGTAAITGQSFGVVVRGFENQIGGTDPGDLNVISGNTSSGVYLLGTSSQDNQVIGNHIGVNLDGDAAIANGSHGIFISGGSDNQIGGSLPGQANVISGNSISGVFIIGADSTGNTLHGNLIGLNRGGTMALPNLFHGVHVKDAADNFIGGAQSGEGNVISGNAMSGVIVVGRPSTGNQITGNTIGLTGDGMSALGNAVIGIQVVFSAQSNEVRDNLIAGNGGTQIGIRGGITSFNTIAGNHIGFASDLTTRIDAGFQAILLSSPSNTIGGPDPQDANVITGSVNGLNLTGSNAKNNVVQGNIFGTNVNSDGPQYAMSHGIRISDQAKDNQIGPDNTIAFSAARGIFVTSLGNGNQITQNEMFSNVTGILLSGPASSSTDPGDGDEGPNRLQNTATSLVVDATTNGFNDDVDIQFDYQVDTLTGNAAYPLTVEFFLSDSSGQGIHYLTSDTYTTPGTKSFSQIFDSSMFPFTPDFGTATVTDANGNTSEFAVAVPVSVSGGGSGEPLAALPPTPAAAYDPMDVNRDRIITARDALQVINVLNSPPINGESIVTQLTTEPNPEDVNRDGQVTALDALLIINRLTQGESDLQDPLTDDAQDAFFAALEDDEDFGVDEELMQALLF